MITIQLPILLLEIWLNVVFGKTFLTLFIYIKEYILVLSIIACMKTFYLFQIMQGMQVEA